MRDHITVCVNARDGTLRYCFAVCSCSIIVSSTSIACLPQSLSHTTVFEGREPAYMCAYTECACTHLPCLP